MTEAEYLKRLGKKITQRREELGLSKEGLATKADLTRMHIYRIENGKTHPTITALRRIAKELKMPLGDLVNMK